MGPFPTLAALASALHVDESDVILGPLAVRDEDDGVGGLKKRAIFDGSAAGITAAIRSHIHVKGDCPLGADALHVMTILENSGEQFGFLKIDGKQAHRWPRVSFKDLRYTCVQLGDDEFWANLGGTYGVGSADFYWRRLMGLVHRLLMRMELMLWALTFVDDLLGFLTKSRFWLLSSTVIATLMALGFPVSWKKLVTSMVTAWTGHVARASPPSLAPSRDKLEKVTAFLEKVAAGQLLASDVIGTGVGRLRWCTSTMPGATPFLQPLHQWNAAVTRAGRPGALHRMIAQLLLKLIAEAPCRKASYVPPSPGEAASDAHATDTEAAIGGWATLSPTATKSEVYWFSISLQRARFPWIWDRGSCPKRLIGAVEFLAVVFLIKLVASLKPGPWHILSRVQSHIDNQGDAFSLLREYSRTLPAALVHMEAAMLAERTGVTLNASHVHREGNRWADALANGDLEGFEPHLRFEPALDGSCFIILDALLATWRRSRRHIG